MTKGLTDGDIGRPNLANTSSLSDGQKASMICHEAVQKSSSSPSFLTFISSDVLSCPPLLLFVSRGGVGLEGGGAEASAWNNPEAIITSNTYWN